MAIHAYTGQLTAKNNSLTVFTVAEADYCDLVVGANQGTVIDEITISSTENVSVIGTIRMFIRDTGEVPVNALHSQVPVPVVNGSPEGGVPTYNIVIRPLNLKLHHNQILRVTFATSSTSTIGFHLTASVTEL